MLSERIQKGIKTGKKKKEGKAQERIKDKKKEPNFNILMLMTGLLMTLIRLISHLWAILPMFSNIHTNLKSEPKL